LYKVLNIYKNISRASQIMMQ